MIIANTYGPWFVILKREKRHGNNEKAYYVRPRLCAIAIW